MSRTCPAGRLFVAVTFLVMASGVVALSLALSKRLTLWPFLGFLLLYNGILVWGFINYLFAVGLFLWVLAAWLATDDSRDDSRRGALRLIAFSLLCYGLLICHLYSCALYGVCVLSVEVARADGWHERLRIWRRRRFWLSLAQFVPALALFVLTSPTGGSLRSIGLFSADLKLHGLGTLVHSGSFALDLSLTVLICLAYLLALRRRWLVLDARLAWAVGALAVLFLVMPDVIFHAGFADFRLPLAIALIAVAATAPRAEPMRGEAWLMFGLCLLMAAQAGYVVWRWSGFDREYAVLDGLLDRVPVGARVLAVFAQDDKLYRLNEPPIAYEPQLSVVRRHVFVNGAFVWPQDNSSLILAPAYSWLQPDRAWFTEYYPAELAAIARNPGGSSVSPFRPAVLASFDYLLIKSPAQFPAATIASFIPVAAADDFALLRLR